MSRIIELKWKCRECGQWILGRHKTCPNDGSPREKAEATSLDGLDEDDYDSRGYNKAATVTDAKLLDLATAGADWFCSHCGAGNRGDSDDCTQCGAPRYGEAEENHPDFPTDHIGSAKSLYPEDEPTETFEDIPSYPDESDDDGFVPVTPDPNDTYKQPLIVAGGMSLFTVGMISFGLILFIGFLIWAFQTHEVVGKVSDSTWQHNVTVWSWEDTTVRKWRHRTTQRREVKPRNGSGERAGMELVFGTCRDEHFDDERYQCGTQQESYDCSYSENYSCTKTKTERYACGETCRDNGNGFATCTTKYCSRQVSYQGTCSRRVPKTCQRTVPKYCTRPIYKPRCTYKTQHWVAEKTYTKSDHGFNTVWPNPDLGPLQKATRNGKWSVEISYKDWGEPYEYVVKPKRESEFKRYRVPSVKLTINNLGGVHEVEPLR